MHGVARIIRDGEHTYPALSASYHLVQDTELTYNMQIAKVMVHLAWNSRMYPQYTSLTTHAVDIVQSLLEAPFLKRRDVPI